MNKRLQNQPSTDYHLHGSSKSTREQLVLPATSHQFAISSNQVSSRERCSRACLSPQGTSNACGGRPRVPRDRGDYADPCDFYPNEPKAPQCVVSKWRLAPLGIPYRCHVAFLWRSHWLSYVS